MRMRNKELESRYVRAAQLMAAMERLHRVWMDFRPLGPVKRSDIMLLGRLVELEGNGTPPPTTGQLARQMRQSPPAITQKVNALERQGFVQRVQDTEDRRVSCIRLTERGRAAIQEAMGKVLSRMDEALDKMGEEKNRQLMLLLQQLGECLENED